MDMTDFGQYVLITPLRVHMARLEAGAEQVIQAQLRTTAIPLERHSSQFHAAGEENWKWNAIRSFFVRLRLIQVLL